MNEVTSTSARRGTGLAGQVKRFPEGEDAKRRRGVP